MNTSSPVLHEVKKNTLKRFGNSTKFLIGRSTSSSLDIPSPYISRTQCIIQLIGDNWILKDLSRRKTTVVNNSYQEEHILKSGDKISFLSYNDEEYIFFNSEDDAPIPSKKRKLIDTSIDTDSDILTPEPPPRLYASLECNVPAILEGKNNEISKKDEIILENEQKILDLQKELYEWKEKHSQAHDEMVSYKKRHDDLVDIYNKGLDNYETNILPALRNEKEKLVLIVEESEADKHQMMAKIKDLTELLQECEEEVERLSAERRCQKNNTKEVDQDSADSNKSEHDLKFLEKEIQDIKKEFQDRYILLTEDMEARRNQVLEALDQEMLCTICNEVLYEPITLNCKHTFCKICVSEWKKKKKECPICREKIKKEVAPLFIDSFIDRIAGVVGGEFMARREEVKMERKVTPPGPGEQVIDLTVASPSPYRQRNGGRGGNRRNERRNQVITLSEVASRPPPVNFPHGQLPPTALQLARRVSRRAPYNSS